MFKWGLVGCAGIMVFTVILVFVFGAALFASRLGDPSGGVGGGGEGSAYFGIGYMFDSDIATAEEIKQIIDTENNYAVFRASNLPGNEDLAQGIIAAAIKHHLNPIYILAHARHETGSTLSRIARDKKNLFGYGAADSCPYECARTFSSYAEGIDFVMGKIKQNYLTPGGSFYMYEEVIPDDKQDKAAAIKAKNNITRIEKETLEAMNIYYASDINWAYAIKNFMKRVYDKLGKPTF